LILAVGLTVGALVGAGCSSDTPGPPSAALGTTGVRPVPAAVADLPLTDQHGATVDLASFRGKTVMVVPFLTLCTDICPLDTGNLLQVERALRGDGAAANVQLIELSIDPERDTPARLAAYSRLTGASWELVTESPAEADQFEHFFGWAVQRVPEDTPPSIDWWTGKPLTYDINHSDGYVVLDARGTERFSTGAAPDFHGTLNPTLHRFLNNQGRQHLAQPQSPGWDPSTAMATLAWILHRPLPVPGG
jgi:protein SCO1/2